MGTLKVMDGSGDSNLIWSADSPDEVAAARLLYDNLKSKKYNAYGVKANGDKGELISDFDPGLQKIIMAPAMRGG